MRIGIDVRATQLGSGLRGIGKYICDVVEGVTRFAPQHEYVIIALPDKPMHPRLQSLPDCCRVVFLPTRLLQGHNWSARKRLLWTAQYLMLEARHGRDLARLATRERLDVLHQPNVTEEKFFPGSRPSCRLVLTFYDAIPAVYPKDFLDRWALSSRYIYRLQIAACAKADTVVAISESARRDAIEYASVPPERIRVVYPSVSEEFAPLDDAGRLDECLTRFGIKTPYFLFCSGLEPTKNVKRIIGAFGQFVEEWPEPYSLVMVSRQSPELHQWAFEAGASRKNLTITGFVSDEDLVTLYGGATALLTPSLYEGFGLPAAQAMRMGTPVIASDRSSQPEVVGDAGLLVDPEDMEAIYGAMRRLAGDAGLRAELSRRGRERVRRFDWQHQAAALLDIYAGTTARENAPRETMAVPSP